MNVYGKKQTQKKIISLGYNCAVSKILKEWGVMPEKNVLDTMVTRQIDDLIGILNAEGYTFFSKDTTQWQQVEGFGNWWVYDTKFNLLSIHDVHLSDEDRFTAIQNQSQQIYHTIDEIRNREDLIILRMNHGHDKVDLSADLYYTISSLRDGKPFSLYVMQPNVHSIPKFDLPGLQVHIANEAIYGKGGGWRHDGSWTLALKSILHELGLSYKEPEITRPFRWPCASMNQSRAKALRKFDVCKVITYL